MHRTAGRRGASDGYELRAKIADGGMAEVHVGRRVSGPGEGEVVAIKTIREQFARNKEFVTMFMDEAKIVVAPAPPQHHPVPRARHRRWRALSRDGAPLRAVAMEPVGRLPRAQRAPSLRHDRVDRGARGRGPALRARARRRARAAARHRAPRRQRDEHLRHLRRGDQGHRLRSREGRQPRVEDGRRRHQGQGRVHVARAGRGRAHRPAHRHLRSRDDALGARLRSAALQALGRRRDPAARSRRGGPRRDAHRRRLSARRSGASSSGRSLATRTSVTALPPTWRATSMRWPARRARPTRARAAVAKVMRELFAEDQARQVSWVAEASGPSPPRRLGEPLKPPSTFWEPRARPRRRPARPLAASTPNAAFESREPRPASRSPRKVRTTQPSRSPSRWSLRDSSVFACSSDSFFAARSERPPECSTTPRGTLEGSDPRSPRSQRRSRGARGERPPLLSNTTSLGVESLEGSGPRLPSNRDTYRRRDSNPHTLSDGGF